MDIATIRAAVKDALSDLDIRVYDYWTSKPSPPCALIRPETIPADEILGGGLRRPSFVVQCLAPMANEEAGTRMVDAWISTGTDTSILDRLVDSTKLIDLSASFPSVSNYRPVVAADGTTLWLSVDITFDVF